MIAEEVLDFIDRRFQYDCNWKTGNCYYFAIILFTRFNKYKPELFYDAIDCHFVTKINGIFYDLEGAIYYDEEYISKSLYKWNDLQKDDPGWASRIVRDVIM